MVTRKTEPNERTSEKKQYRRYRRENLKRDNYLTQILVAEEKKEN